MTQAGVVASLYGPKVKHLPARVGRRVYRPRPPLEWMERRLRCRDNPELFYSLDVVEQYRALALCLACPVMAECLRDVLTWAPDLREVGMTAGGQYWEPAATVQKRAKTLRAREARDEAQSATDPVPPLDVLGCVDGS